MFSTRDLPSWWSEVLQASMKVCATTLRHESTMFAFPRSNTKFGFLIRFTQNLQKVALQHSSSDKEGQNIKRRCRFLRILRLAINHYHQWQIFIIKSWSAMTSPTSRAASCSSKYEPLHYRWSRAAGPGRPGSRTNTARKTVKILKTCFQKYLWFWMIYSYFE